MQQSETLAFALHYLAAGLHPFPLNPRSKIPLKGFALKRLQTEKPTEKEIYKWFGHGENNIGLVLGRGMVAVDLDGEGAEELLAAHGVTLPANAPRSQTKQGYHVFLATSEPLGDRVAMLCAGYDTNKKPIKPCVDIRGVGYVVAPPSIHESGHKYEWLHRIGPGIPAAPVELVNLIKATGGQSAQNTAKTGQGGPETPKWVAEAMAGVGEGLRDATCAKLAGYFIKKHPADIVKATLYGFGAACTPPFPRDQVNKCVDSVQRIEAAAVDARATQREFQVLGYDQGAHFYLPKGSRQVVQLRADQHTQLHLLRLAPLEYWEANYSAKTGVQWNLAANALMRLCEHAGVYSPERVRGRGAWWDGGGAVIHMGDSLITNGVSVPVMDVPPGKFIYEAAPPMPINLGDPLNSDEANKIIDIVECINWEKKISGHLLAGWAAIAPICGALSWRPHIWITGPAGSGKTWVVEKVLRQLIGGMGLAVQSETTEAGLRQTLGNDARPVIFDEIEGEDLRAQQRIQNVLALARQASSETGAAIIKGSPLGNAKSYRIRSCFALSSIGVGLEKHADSTRVSVLSIEMDHREDKAERFHKLNTLVGSTINEDYASRFIARSIRLAPVIRANAKTLTQASAAVIGSQRLGDQIGALLAGCYSLYQDGLLTPEDAKQWVEGQDWSEQKNVHDSNDESMCLQRILEHVVHVQVKSFVGPRSVAELVRAAAGGADAVLQSDAEATLWRAGIRVDDDTFTISNNHTAISDMLKGTHWSKGWGRVLRRCRGARPTLEPVRFGALRGRGVQLPIDVHSQDVHTPALFTVDREQDYVEQEIPF